MIRLGRRIAQGYLPYWQWRSLRFQWWPSPQLMEQWIQDGEIG